MPSSRARKTASPPPSPLPETPAAAPVKPARKSPRRVATPPVEPALAIAAETAPAAARKATARRTAKTDEKADVAKKTPARKKTVAPAVAEPAVPVRKRAASRKRAPAVAEAAVPEAAVREGLPPVAAPEPEPSPVLEPVLAPNRFSEVRLESDAWGRRLVWQAAGEGCPDALQQHAQSLLNEDGGFDLQRDEGLLALQALAVEHGHELRIDPALWVAVAACRDVRWRIHHLEQAYPEGAASGALQALWPAVAGRLAPFHWEGGLFAACAGRSVLADEAGLDPVLQALLAARLLALHFGVQRVLVVCPESAVVRWQQAGARAGLEAVLHLTVESRPVDPADASPDLVIVDDVAAWPDGGAACAAARTMNVPYALVLMHDPAERPAALAEWLAWLDGGLGASRRFLRRHRDEAAARWTGLDRLRDTLGDVMLRRPRSRWLQPVPGRRDRLVWLPLGGAECAALDAARRQLQPVVDRWRRVQYVSDQDQVLVRTVLDALRQVGGAATAMKVRALCDQWAELQAHGMALQVCGAPGMDLEPLLAGLRAAGLPVHPHEGGLRVGEPPSEAAPPQPVQRLCPALPWPAATVLADGGNGAAPVVYLLTEGGIDEHRLLLRCCDPDADAALADPVLFRQGAGLARRMAALAAWVDRLHVNALRDTR